MSGGITDYEARRKDKALAVFKNWLLTRSRDDLLAADPAERARQYPPLEADDIAQMIRVRAKAMK